MCGILGRYDSRGHITNAEYLARLVNLLHHRGPDGGAYWSDGGFFLGHRRLAIIDLSATGDQPMGCGGRLVTVFNGEIYNYVELREELIERGYTFSSSSDTEVLLHGYAAWGTDLPKRLIGMFAFAIVDLASNTLFLARDRFGEKPLLYADDAHGITFASELAPLAALQSERQIDLDGLGGYLCLNYVPGSRTLLRGVSRLAPGTWRLYGPGRSVTAGRFYDPFVRPRELAITTDEAVRELEVRVDAAVQMALRSDVPVGMFLSGGVDSSIVATSAVRSGKLSQAYCLTFADPGFSEWKGASSTAAQLGIPLRQVKLTPSALQDFCGLVEHADDPLADSSSLALWTLSRAAASTNKVVLSGDGGDELFGGYLTYKASALHTAITSRFPYPLRRFLARLGSRIPTRETKVSATYKAMRYLRAIDLPPALAHLTWNGTWLPTQAASFVTPEYRERVAGGLSRLLALYGVPDRPSFGDLQSLDLSEYLPNDILVKTDRMTMAHGLEVRAPLLAAPVADFALALAADLNSGIMGKGKRLMRSLAERRYNLTVAKAPKQGFSIPIHTWVREFMQELTADLLSRKSIEATGFLSASAVQRVVDDHAARQRSYGWELWGLMVLVHWHRCRVARAPEAPAPPVAEIKLHAPSER